jgi:hypothetical protein
LTLREIFQKLCLPAAPLSVQIQTLECGKINGPAVGVFEFVALLDDKVQEKFLENFWGGST